MTDKEVEKVINFIQKYVAETALDPNVEHAFAQVEQTLQEELTYLKRMKERTNV